MTADPLGRLRVRPKKAVRQVHQTVKVRTQRTHEERGQTESWWLRYQGKDQRLGFTALAEIHRVPVQERSYGRPIFRED